MKKRYRIPLFTLVFLAVALIALHIALPVLVRDYLNKQLADMGDYRGHIADIDLALWRGAYKINDLQIVKVNGKVPVPLLKAPSIDLAVSWRALWQQRAVVAEVEFVQPELTFVDGGNAANSQTGEGVDWRAQLRGLLPIHLNDVRVIDGTLAFRNFTAQPAVDLKATQLNAQVRNLTNVSDSTQPRPATLNVNAQVLGNAPLELKSAFDPLGELDDFDLQLRITQIQLKQLNSFTRAYANFDFASGNGDMVLELQARQGKLKGYAKPLLRQAEIFNWQQDVAAKDKSLLNGLWEALVGSGGWIFKNHRQDQLATRVEIRGDLNAYEISRWQAFKAILRNAFVQAFNSQFDSQQR
ncbi:DUF748 domain-containing protein [Pseudomonas sp. 5P_3.1_Bac2]|uniref:DUF748 domain-containing protein n=1 Tax=Pseudomonas sp. 5P_3.1_Bac2 TaxID=2971617 RepID=UPI0021CA5883|nr:DUF748 domain-containing protein [Pseudomonas sp. 5P_3.1_Bac2]MCU1716883.1 DUF748 domain-containing protein [Pseudomonas sp. 5P_3.1_Bac2]